MIRWTLMMKTMMAAVAVRVAVPVEVKVIHPIAMRTMIPKRSQRSRRASLWMQWIPTSDSTGELPRHPPGQPNLAITWPKGLQMMVRPLHRRTKVTRMTTTMMLTAASKAAIRRERRRLPREEKKKKPRVGKLPSPTALQMMPPKHQPTSNVWSRAVPTAQKFGSSTWRSICRLPILIALATLQTARSNASNFAKRERSSMSGQPGLRWNSNMEPRNRCRNP
mmetsp:Transcript_5762/g.14395  ORF Transcript_5762/g.14395 Transcript_5762/m.14395 type:complete len:222 (-) Transcript_5762:3050-3715(-)